MKVNVVFDGKVCFLIIGVNDIGFPDVAGNLEQINFHSTF